MAGRAVALYIVYEAFHGPGAKFLQKADMQTPAVGENHTKIKQNRKSIMFSSLPSPTPSTPP